MRRVRLLGWGCVAAGIVIGCKHEAAASGPAVTIAPPPPAYDHNAPCEPTGQWAVCSVIYRLNRAGFDMVRDTIPAKEKVLAQPGMRLKLGDGTLSVFIYPDTVNRHLDELHLDPKGFISPEAEWMPQKRTLIRSMNLLVLMDVANGRTRERIADAILAGPPQPPAKAMLPASTTRR